MEGDPHPVAVIGAGPVGLAAAARLVARAERPLVLEAGPSAGASVLRWGHVRIFSPWRHDVDAVAAGLLEAAGWTHPEPGEHPTVGPGSGEHPTVGPGSGLEMHHLLQFKT